MDLLGQSALVLSVTAFSLAVTSLSRNLKNSLVLMYAFFCGIVSGWSFFFFLEKLYPSGLFYRIHLVFHVFLVPAGLFFTGEISRHKFSFLKWVNRGVALYSLVLATLLWTAWGQRNFMKNLVVYTPAFLFLSCVFFVVHDLYSRKKERFYPAASDKQNLLRRRTWIYIGGVCILSLATMDHVPSLGEVIPSIGNILFCIYLFMVSEMLIHQRLLPVRQLLSQAAVLILLSSGLTLVYLILVSWIHHSSSLLILNTFISSLIILLLIEPVKKLMNMVWLKFFSRSSLRIQDKIQEYQEKFIGVIDGAGLANLVLQFCDEILQYESATFFILRSDGTKYKRLRGMRDQSLNTREILSTHPMISYLKEQRFVKGNERPLLLDQFIENERQRTISDQQKRLFQEILTGLKGLQASMVIPLIAQGQILGFISMHVARPPEAWGNSWAPFLEMYPFFHQAAETLKNMDVYVRLREKDRLAALGEMAAGLAHEIRNPLGAIKGAAQLLQNTQTENQFLRVIVEEVDRLNKVVVQFLDYSRPWSIAQTSCDVQSLMESTCRLFETTSQTKKYSIEIVDNRKELESLPPFYCDSEKIKQVLVNLIQNSVMALESQENREEPGKIRIGANVEKRWQDGSLELILFVEDNGPGISKENIDKIFIPFFTTSPQGTGLGLSICAKIVEAHAGRIEAISEEGKFTRFLITLPTKPKEKMERGTLPPVKKQ